MDITMETASEEPPYWMEEGCQEMCGKKWSSTHSSGTNIPKVNAKICPWTNNFTSAVKSTTLPWSHNTRWNEVVSTGHRVHRLGCGNLILLIIGKACQSPLWTSDNDNYWVSFKLYQLLKMLCASVKCYRKARHWWNPILPYIIICTYCLLECKC